MHGITTIAYYSQSINIGRCTMPAVIPTHLTQCVNIHFSIQSVAMYFGEPCCIFLFSRLVYIHRPTHLACMKYKLPDALVEVDKCVLCSAQKFHNFWTSRLFTSNLNTIHMLFRQYTCSTIVWKFSCCII